MMFAAAKGNTYIDDKGEVWIDLLSGILNVTLGHGSDEVKGAMQEVMSRGLINCYDRSSEPKARLQENLDDFFPGYNWKFCSTGAEAVERALQSVAVLRRNRYVGRVVVFPSSFHGKSIELSGLRYNVPWKNAIEFIQAKDVTNVTEFDAILYEPFCGWDGERNYISNDLFQHAKRAGAYIIADEMITGFGRCGRRFMSHNADFLVSGKGLSQGLPLSVMGISKRIENLDLPIGWTTTGGGNALSCLVGAYTLESYKKNLIYSENYEFFDIACEELRSHKIRGQGALIYIRVGDTAALKRKMEASRIVASYHGEWLRLAPCYNFPRVQFRNLLKTMKGMLQ